MPSSPSRWRPGLRTTACSWCCSMPRLAAPTAAAWRRRGTRTRAAPQRCLGMRPSSARACKNPCAMPRCWAARASTCCRAAWRPAGRANNSRTCALALRAAAQPPTLKVLTARYPCQIAGGDVAAKLQRYLPTGRVAHIQIAGVPGRHEPDRGELNYPFLFEMLDALGYSRWVGCEYRPEADTSAGLAWRDRALAESAADS